MTSAVRRSTRLLSLSSRSATTLATTQLEPEPTRPRKRQRVIKETSKSTPSNDGNQVASSSSHKTVTVPRRKGKQIDFTPSDFPPLRQSEWKVGAHVSAAGGVENTIINAAAIGASAFALFVKSQRKWSSPPLTAQSIATFKSRMKEFGYSSSHVLPHGSYLINLGNPDEYALSFQCFSQSMTSSNREKREKSYVCFLDDLRRCELLGLELYNLHPGSTVGEATPEESISLIAQAINRAHQETNGVTVVLENMAGSGNIIGSTFAQLGSIIRDVEDKNRVGICLDTCHTFAAGYDIRTREGWNSVCESYQTSHLAIRRCLYTGPVEQLDRDVGIKYLRGMHLNDSKTPLDSKKDRHENIGVGHLELSTFTHIMTDPRIQNIPLILETPAFDGPGLKLGEGMSIWQKEIDVLYHISEGIPSPRELQEWEVSIKDVVSEAAKSQDSKQRRRNHDGSSSKSRKRKVKEESESDEE